LEEKNRNKTGLKKTAMSRKVLWVSYLSLQTFKVIKVSSNCRKKKRHRVWMKWSWLEKILFIKTLVRNICEDLFYYYGHLPDVQIENIYKVS
jgi:hypothetical protein